jgi:hypothetical protein
VRLNVWAFAFTCAIIWGLGVFFITWWVIYFEGPTGEVTVLGHIYRGFNISAMGSLIGLIWGFFDGLIGGLIFAWLYNLLAGKPKAAAAE